MRVESGEERGLRHESGPKFYFHWDSVRDSLEKVGFAEGFEGSREMALYKSGSGIKEHQGRASGAI